MCVFTSSRAFHKSWSECWLKGSRFFLMVPVNRTGSCGMIDIFRRRSCKPISDVNTPSTKILPSGSVKRNSAEIRELFPAPVRPTIPTWPMQSRKHQCTRPDSLTCCSGAAALDSPSLWVWTWPRCSWGWRVHQSCRRSWLCRRLSGPDWASREGGVSGFPKVLRFLALCIRQLSPLTSSRQTHYAESKSVYEGLRGLPCRVDLKYESI